MTKVLLIIALVILIGGFLWQSYHIKTEKLIINIKNLPKGFDGFKIVHISDLHGRRLSKDGYAHRLIKRVEPDIVTITGDFVSSNVSEMDNFMPFLSALSSAVPIYAVSGNHDYEAGWTQVKGKLLECGVNVLENSHVFLHSKGDRICLAGVSDPSNNRANLAAALPQTPTETTILLAHSPTWFEVSRFSKKYEREIKLLKNISLTLCGHTHGGQIKLPFLGAVTTASKRLFPKNYVEGLSWEGNGWLYISRGIGYATLPFRFLSPPEITVIVLKTEN